MNKRSFFSLVLCLPLLSFLGCQKTPELPLAPTLGESVDGKPGEFFLAVKGKLETNGPSTIDLYTNKNKDFYWIKALGPTTSMVFIKTSWKVE